jgi:8-amino-7-oxononanoate synthase
MINNFQNWITDQIKGIKSKNQHRILTQINSGMGPEIIIDGKRFIQFASNNYLGLTMNKKVINSSKKILERYGTGTGGSRLVTGTSNLHYELEKKIADFKNTKSSLVFSSGYLANIGTISAIMSSKDIIFSDELNHASLIDGARISKAQIVIYKHCDMKDLEKKLKSVSRKNIRKMILTDSVFSMDGDIAPLDEIVFLSAKYDCITMIDEAHATGVLGKKGSGASEMFGVEKKIDICMGTLSKAVGSVGGYIAGSKKLIDFLKNKARTFIFDTSLPAPALKASMDAIDIIQNSDGPRKNLQKNILNLTEFLVKEKFNFYKNDTPIIPIIFGSELKTLKFSKMIKESGIYIPAVRPPSVPKGLSRIRITLMANHSQKHMEKLKRVLKKIKKFN